MTVSESSNPRFRNSWLYREPRLDSCLFLQAASRKVERQKMFSEGKRDQNTKRRWQGEKDETDNAQGGKGNAESGKQSEKEEKE